MSLWCPTLWQKGISEKNNTFQKHECVPSVHFASIKRRRKKDLREEAGTHFMLYSWQNSYGPYALGERWEIAEKLWNKQTRRLQEIGRSQLRWEDCPKRRLWKQRRKNSWDKIATTGKNRKKIPKVAILQSDNWPASPQQKGNNKLRWDGRTLSDGNVSARPATLHREMAVKFENDLAYSTSRVLQFGLYFL